MKRDADDSMVLSRVASPQATSILSARKKVRTLYPPITASYCPRSISHAFYRTGWAPSNFVSSRADRAKKKQARPEDFMDEEDLAELAESRTLIDTTEEMDLLGGTAAERARKGTDDEEAECVT
jgi:G patch domain-containing protein 1